MTDDIGIEALPEEDAPAIGVEALPEEDAPAIELEVEVQDSVSVKDAEAWAVGQRGGVDVVEGDPTYHNNAKYYAEQGEYHAEAWAVGERGGVPVESGDPTYHNNAKWYAQAAEDAAASASAAYGTDLLAPTFDQATAYPAGQHVIHEGGYYVLPEGHTAGDTWAETSKTQQTVGGEVTGLKSALDQVNGATLLDFESGGIYGATGIEYPSSTKSRTAFVRVTPGGTYHFCFDVAGISSVSVFEFASNVKTEESVNERLAVTAIQDKGEITLTNGTYFIRVQVNVATSDIINPIIMLNGGYVDFMFDNALRFKGVLPSGSVNIVADMTGIWQLIGANTYTDLPYDGAIGWLEVIKTNTWTLQRFTNSKPQNIWTRKLIAGTWSTWCEVGKEYDLLFLYGNHESWTHRDVTFTWNSDNTVCTAVGTNDGTNPSVSRFYANQYEMPSWIEPGKTYYFTYESTGVAPSFFIELFSNGTSIFQKAYRKNDAIRIPLNTTGITLRLNVYPSATVDGTVSVRFDEMMTNLELSKELYDSKTFGIDFLRTYGNRTNSSSHGVSYTSVASVPCKYHIAGTVSSSESTDSTYSVYFGAIPAGIEDGDKLIVQLQTEPAGTAGLGMVVTFYDEYMSVIDRVYEYNLRMDLPLTIPKDSKYMRMTLFVIKGNTVDVTTEVKLVKLRPQKMDVPLIISIVDDDISNDTYVTKFHDACLHNNIVGNYAVITKNITDGNTTLEKLLDYEDE